MVTKALSVSFISMAVAFQLGCGSSNDSGINDSDINLELELVLPFTKNPAASVLQSGTVGNPVFIADPGVIKDESGYHLFMTNQFCDLNNNSQWDAGEHLFDADNTLLCVANRGVGATMYAFSDDKGKTWSVRPRPAIEPSLFGWDNFNVETAFPFIYDDTLYILYSAYGDRDGEFFQTRYQIGLASVALNGRTVKQAMVDDDITLTKFGNGAEPLLAGNVTTSDYDNNTQEPSVVVSESGFELYFTGLRLSNPEIDLTPGNGNNITGIALMRQKFDFNWVKVGNVEVAHTIEGLLPGTEELALSPVNIGEVYFFSGKYHIFYTTLENNSDFHNGERIAHAVSDDGLSWSDTQVILERGDTESDFDGWGIMAPSVVFEDNEAILFYSAWGETSNSACIMNGAGAKWGQQVANASKCVHGNLGRSTAVLQTSQ